MPILVMAPLEFCLSVPFCPNGLKQPLDEVEAHHATLGRRLNGFLGLSLNDRTILFIVILLDKTVSIGEDSICITTLVSFINRILLNLSVVQFA